MDDKGMKTDFLIILGALALSLSSDASAVKPVTESAASSRSTQAESVERVGVVGKVEDNGRKLTVGGAVYFLAPGVLVHSVSNGQPSALPPITRGSKIRFFAASERSGMRRITEVWVLEPSDQR